MTDPATLSPDGQAGDRLLRIRRTPRIGNTTEDQDGGLPPPWGRPSLTGLGDSATARRTRAAMVSICRVDAGGIPAEWVESTVATAGQATFVHFSEGGSGDEGLRIARGTVRALTLATGARVFSVGCRLGPAHRQEAAVEDGLTAYAWLLEEGLDLQTSAFIAGETPRSVAGGVLAAATHRGLPPPTGAIGTSASRSEALAESAAARYRQLRAAPPA